MDGFLPLVEAFLAFALTMLALTTAVSAIVGTLQRALRWRPRVLRQMVEFLYRNEVEDRVAGLYQQASAAGQPDGDTPPSADAGRPAGSDLPKDVAAYLASLAAGGEPSDRRIAADHRHRFVAHMTLLPTVLLGPDGQPDRLAREKEIAKTDREADGTGGGKGSRIAAFRSWLAGWDSLRHGRDRLTDAEFLVRLRSSLPGQAIAALAGNRAEAVLADLKSRFDTHGLAAINLFEKRSRKWSVAVGFVLAFGINVDALFLLNSYLTNDELRQRIIENSDEIVANADSDLSELARAGADMSPEVDKLNNQVQDAARILGSLSEASASALDQIAIDGLQDSIDRAKQRVDAFQGTLDTAVAAAADVSQVSAEIRGVALSLTESFPVGWTLYPNCPIDGVDPRCKSAQMSDGRGFWSGLLAVTLEDTSGFVKWLMGTLITGLMVGLGTPFWIQIVNGALRARNLLRDSRPPEPAPAGERRLL